MSFNSYTFFLFLGIILVLHKVLPWSIGRVVLLVGSYVFYGAANPYYCLLLFASTYVDFVVARKLESSAAGSRKKRLLLVSIVFNIGILGFFKYGAFLAENVNYLLPLDSVFRLPLLETALPIGISFYTFQTLSYTIDVYRGRTKASHSFREFALYVAYFPQLVAGPIERAAVLLPQLAQKNAVNSRQFLLGIERILWGVAKKSVIADRLAVFVNQVFADPSSAGSPALILAAAGFMLQLYLDFSAYCDIALGSASLMGVRLSENFDYPLAARNPNEFWTRWHMTLTRWFTDYVFRPLGGFRPKSPIRGIFNTLLVFSLIGLWHGAAWHFVAFGFAAGLLSVTYQALRLQTKRATRGSVLGDAWWSWPLALGPSTVSILLTGILFRSPTLGVAWDFFQGILFNPVVLHPDHWPYVLLIGLIWSTHLLGRFSPFKMRNGGFQPPGNPVVVCLVLFLLILFGAYEHSETFIYFEF